MYQVLWQVLGFWSLITEVSFFNSLIIPQGRHTKLEISLWKPQQRHLDGLPSSSKTSGRGDTSDKVWRKTSRRWQAEEARKHPAVEREQCAQKLRGRVALRIWEFQMDSISLQLNGSGGERGQGTRLGWYQGPFPATVKILAFIQGWSKPWAVVVSGEIKSVLWVCADVLRVGTGCRGIVSILRSSGFAASHPCIYTLTGGVMSFNTI